MRTCCVSPYDRDLGRRPHIGAGASGLGGKCALRRWCPLRACRPGLTPSRSPRTCCRDGQQPPRAQSSSPKSITPQAGNLPTPTPTPPVPIRAWLAALGGTRRTAAIIPVRPLDAYQLISTGTCTSASSGGPSGTGASIKDGTCTWKYLSNVDYISITGWAFDNRPWKSGTL